MKLTQRSKLLLPCVLPILIVAACMPSLAQMTSVGVNCSQVSALQIHKQENMRAGRVMIECGLAPAGRPAIGQALPPTIPNARVSNRTCASNSSCTKSENMIWASSADGGTTLVDTYNDHNPTFASYSGTSYSKNAGLTWKEIVPPPFATGHGTNFGDPIVVFNAKLGKFFAGDLVSGSDCGGQGIGLWTSPDGIAWTVGSCPHVGSSDDRQSMWVDNEPSSGTYGRMYVSWNNFATGGSLVVTYSDDGVVWVAPVVLNAGFIRNVQLTGSPVGAARFEGTNSTVFVATMDEGGGGLNTRQNFIYKSLDGGATWSSFSMGARFNPPGNVSCGYFEAVAPIWRHMGWGQPAVGPAGVVHYAYAGAGSAGDVGDVFYVKSTDNGVTWSAPIQLNTDPDGPNKTQWMPSVSADGAGKVTATWYDRRKAAAACSIATNPGCKYEIVGRQSTDNGVTFNAAVTISNTLIAQPQQTDPGVQACYAGDYDYDTNLNGNAYVTWTDGRRAVTGIHVQDVEFAKAP